MTSITSNKKYFNILPSICVIKTINPLSESAKKTFGHTWDYYYSVRFSFLKWSYKF